MLSIARRRLLPGLVLLAASVAAAASAQVPEGARAPTAAASAPAPLSVWAESLAKRFAACFTPYGAAPGFPVAVAEPHPREVIAQAALPAPVLVSDGYHHELRVHGPTRSVFIVQTGGLGGERTVFGPLSTKAGCPGTGTSASEGARRRAVHDEGGSGSDA